MEKVEVLNMVVEKQRSHKKRRKKGEYVLIKAKKIKLTFVDENATIKKFNVTKAIPKLYGKNMSQELLEKFRDDLSENMFDFYLEDDRLVIRYTKEVVVK